jgi:hypothetical protein
MNKELKSSFNRVAESGAWKWVYYSGMSFMAIIILFFIGNIIFFSVVDYEYAHKLLPVKFSPEQKVFVSFQLLVLFLIVFLTVTSIKLNYFYKTLIAPLSLIILLFLLFNISF